MCITHAHGDHFDPSAILAIHDRSPALQVIAPLPVTRWMQHAGMLGKHDGPRLVPVRRGTDIEIRGVTNALRVGILLDPNFPCIANPRRVGYLVYPEGGAGVAHLDDSHGPDPSWKKYLGHVGGIVTWLRETPGELRSYFMPGNRLARIWYIHWESFQPGHFDCNQDPLPRTNDPAVPPGMAGLLSFTEWSALPGSEAGKNE